MLRKATHCGCAEPLAVTHYHSGGRLVVNFRCTGCATEWSVVTLDVDPVDPVTSDEVLEVRARLKGEGVSLDELLRE